MMGDRDDVARLFDQIASEQGVIDQLAATVRRLQAIQQASGQLAALSPADLRRAVAQRHAALAVGK